MFKFIQLMYRLKIKPASYGNACNLGAKLRDKHYLAEVNNGFY